MSILTKGMDMPTCCADCDLHNPFSETPYCRRLLKVIPIEGRMENCPLIEVEEYQAVNDQTGDVEERWAKIDGRSFAKALLASFAGTIRKSASSGTQGGGD